MRKTTPMTARIAISVPTGSTPSEQVPTTTVTCSECEPLFAETIASPVATVVMLAVNFFTSRWAMMLATNVP